MPADRTYPFTDNYAPRRHAWGGEIPDNLSRADRAASCLDLYAQLARGTDEDVDTMLGDLLCDLRHLARREEVPFDDVLRLSEQHFNEEVDEESQPC